MFGREDLLISGVLILLLGLTYLLGYHLMIHKTHEKIHATVVLYGFTQAIIGFTAGYCASRLRDKHTVHHKTPDDEEMMLFGDETQ